MRSILQDSRNSVFRPDGEMQNVVPVWEMMHGLAAAGLESVYSRTPIDITFRKGKGPW